MEISQDQAKQMVGQVMRLMCLVYLSIARQAIERYGQRQGKEIILKGTRTFGYTRGKQIAERVKKAGEPLTLENFFKFYDISLSAIVEQSAEPPIKEKGKFTMKITSCPLADFFKGEDQVEVGRLYCEQDYTMIEGYNPKIKLLKKRASLMEGDKYCEFVYSFLEDI